MDELVEGALGGIHVGLEGIVAVISAIIGLVVWLVRLEGKVQAHDREIIRNDTRTTNLEDNVLRRLSLIEKTLARIEGRLSMKPTVHDDNH